MMNFNAYIHARPDGTVFYVGKGSIARSKEMFRSRNPHHTNVVKKYGKENILVGSLPCSSDEISMELEKGLIKCFRRMGVDLVNQTDGGEGTKGLKKSAEECQAISERMRKFWADPLNKESTSESMREAYADPELRNRLSTAKMGNQSRVGKKNSSQHNEALRQANIGKTPSDETRQKMSIAAKNRKVSDETRAKMSASHSARYTNPENRLKTAEDTKLGIKRKKEQRA